MARSRVVQFPVFGLQNPQECATAYVAVSNQGVLQDENGDLRPARENEKPTYWSVYGTKTDGSVEWIGDFGNQLMCWMFTAQLSYILGVIVEGESFNLDPLEAAVHMMNNAGPSH